MSLFGFLTRKEQKKLNKDKWYWRLIILSIILAIVVGLSQ